jgi:hypothetical protein
MPLCEVERRAMQKIPIPFKEVLLIIKIAMINIHNKLKDENWKS